MSDQILTCRRCPLSTRTWAKACIMNIYSLCIGRIRETFDAHIKRNIKSKKRTTLVKMEVGISSCSGYKSCENDLSAYDF